MTVGKEWKLILLFSLPIIAGSLLQQLYNTVDGIIVGNFVSEEAFSSVATCQPLVFLFLSLALGLSVGVNIVVSQYFGAGKHDKLPVAIDTAMLLLGACGLLLTAVALIITPSLLRNVLSVPKNLLPQAITYFRIYAFGLFFQFLYNGIAATLRGLGDSKATLYFLLITTVLNTGLDLFFIVVFKWNVAGAAIATVIAQVVCAAASYIYLRRRFPYVKSGAHWNREIAVTMTRLGLPIAIQQGIVSVGNGTMQRLVNGFADTVPGVVAAFGAGFRLDSFIFVPIMGFQSGLASFTGQNMGAGRLDRVNRGFRMTLIMSLSVTIVMCALLYGFAENVVSAFGLTDDALAIGVEQIRYMTKFFWMFSGYMALGGLLQGAGDTVLQSASTLSALIVRILTGYLAVSFGILNYSAAWLTTPIGWGIAIIITYTRYFTGGWKKKAVAGKLKHVSDFHEGI
jgi:putative MATE family efflux protein